MQIQKSTSALVFHLLFVLLVAGQTETHLPRSVPEKEGVSSAAIIQFLEAADKSKTSFHSFMLLRHGKVIAEGWWNPYRSDLLHTLYSTSKSFTATAVGFAVHEKLLSLDDKVKSFFPGQAPDTADIKLEHLTVKDALMMSDGQEPDPTYKIVKDSNWIRSFLSTPIKYEPGTKFLYNTLGTYMLSAIVQKVTGQPILDYLQPRLFAPLGITGIDWETDSKGVNTGGWGLRLHTEDIAKFGQLFLQKGKWEGKQILPEGWVEEASTMKIMQNPDAPQSKKDSSDWLQGYCYQMWRCRNNAYRGDGAFGQFMIVMPDQDAAIAITAETADMQEEIDLVWKYLLPAFKNDPLPANRKGQKKLKARLQTLAVAPAKSTKTVPSNQINGKKFLFAANDFQFKSLSFTTNNKSITLNLETPKASYPLSFGEGKWVQGTTEKTVPSLLKADTGVSYIKDEFLYPAKVTGSYSWKDPQTLQLVLRYIESPHAETYTCHFDGNKLMMDLEKSLWSGNRKQTFTATTE